jgi:hypothetical protein
MEWMKELTKVVSNNRSGIPDTVALQREEVPEVEW